MILGRGSFTEPFPLFGYELSDYDALFTPKVELFAQLRGEGPITWSGQHRSALTGQENHPKTEHPNGLPAWIGVGGSPHSVVRAVQVGIPMMLASIELSDREVIPRVRELLGDSEASR